MKRGLIGLIYLETDITGQLKREDWISSKRMM